MPTSSTAPASSPAQSVGAGDVLALIRSGRASTRGALGRMTGLSRTAVGARLGSLPRAGLVSGGAQAHATGGRPSSTLVFNADAGLVLAVAPGRSRSQVAVCDLHGAVLAQVSHEQEVGAGPGTVMPVVVDHLREMRADLGRPAS